MTAIEIDGLSKRFGDHAAVRDLSLTVERGEVFGFLGPNGAGKSTTINAMLDFVRPTAGGIRVLGHDPRKEPRAVRDRIGILPEGYDLYDRLSARRHLTFAADLEASDADPGAVLERVGLADDAGRPVGEFSKGMRQRLALGMALVGEPDLLILDEPSSGLDPNGARMMRDVVREENQRGATVFFSSHILDQVEAVCDRVGIMDDGELVAVDTVAALGGASGPSSTLVVSVDEVPTDHGLAALDGVTDVTTGAGSLRVGCSDPAIKAVIISRVESAGATVTDIDVEETDLADVFAAYTDESDAPEVDA